MQTYFFNFFTFNIIKNSKIFFKEFILISCYNFDHCRILNIYSGRKIYGIFLKMAFCPLGFFISCYNGVKWSGF